MKYNDERSRYRAPARYRYAGLTQRVCDRDYGNPNLPRAPAPVAAAATAAPALPFHAGKPATTVAEWRSCRLTAFSGAAPMAAFGGAHHQAGFQQMATGFPGVVAGGFIQGGAPKVLLVNNLCEGVSRCFTLWPQCCLTDGLDFSGHLQPNLHSMWGTAHSSKERRRPLFMPPFSTVAEPALGLMVPISRFRAFRRRKQRKNGKQRVKNGWIGIWRRDTCEDPGMPHRPKQSWLLFG